MRSGTCYRLPNSLRSRAQQSTDDQEKVNRWNGLVIIHSIAYQVKQPRYKRPPEYSLHRWQGVRRILDQRRHETEREG